MSETETKKIPDVYVVVDGTTMPAAAQPPQSELQGAFVVGGTQAKPRIVIDMAKALPLAQDMVRQARASAFALNDGAFMRAQQQGQATTAFVAKGNQLRDAPADPRLTAATTPDALLKAVEDIIAEF